MAGARRRVARASPRTSAAFGPAAAMRYAPTSAPTRLMMTGLVIVLCCATTYYYTSRNAERACKALGAHNGAACFQAPANVVDLPPPSRGPSLDAFGTLGPGIPTRGANALRDAYAASSSSSSSSSHPSTPSLPTTATATAAATMAGLPINIRTSGAHNASYSQVGFLSNGKEDILALHGRMIMPNRNKWQYYTNSDKFHSVRLPITVGGKNASSEYGCDEVSNGDSVYVEGYNMPFRVTLYEKEGLQYIPYL